MEKNYHVYSEPERQWLIDNINKFTYKKLTEEFNKVFQTNVSEASILNLCNKHLQIYKRRKIEKPEKIAFRITKATVISGQQAYLFSKKELQKYITKGKYSNLKITYSKGTLRKGCMKLHTSKGYFKIRFDVLNNKARRITYV